MNTHVPMTDEEYNKAIELLHANNKKDIKTPSSIVDRLWIESERRVTEKIKFIPEKMDIHNLPREYLEFVEADAQYDVVVEARKVNGTLRRKPEIEAGVGI